MQKKIILVILCTGTMLLGCSAPSPWHLTYMDTANETSARLEFLAKDAINAANLVFTQVGGKLQVSLEMHGFAIPPFQGKESEAQLLLQYGTTSFQEIVMRRQGGQRVILTQKAQEALITALLQYPKVTVSVHGYTTLVEAANFAKAFKNLYKSPIHNPIRLPFAV